MVEYAVEGEPYALYLDFGDARAFHGFMGGFELAHARLEPGKLHILASIRSSIEAGREWANLGRGGEDYKQWFRPEPFVSTLGRGDERAAALARRARRGHARRPAALCTSRGSPRAPQGSVARGALIGHGAHRRPAGRPRPQARHRPRVPPRMARAAAALAPRAVHAGSTSVAGPPVRFTHPQAFVAQYRAMFHERMYAAALGPAPVILDVGANYGLATIALKAEHPDAEIVAFEADPAIAAIAATNIARPRACDDVTLVRAAAWTSEGTMRFAAEGSDAGRLGDEGGLEVPTVRLRDWLDRDVDLLKMDIEGAEVDVLLDCADRLDRVGSLVCEYHSFAGRPQRLGEMIGAPRERRAPGDRHGRHGPGPPAGRRARGRERHGHAAQRVRAAGVAAARAGARRRPDGRGRRRRGRLGDAEAGAGAALTHGTPALRPPLADRAPSREAGRRRCGGACPAERSDVPDSSGEATRSARLAGGAARLGYDTTRISRHDPRDATARRPSLLTAPSARPRPAPRPRGAPRRDAGRTGTKAQYAPSPRTTADTVRARSLRSRRSDHVAA